MVSFCAGCNEKINDRYLMKVLDKTWHSECLVCVECGAPLAEKCYTKNGKFYCKADFNKKEEYCHGCQKSLSVSDLVLRPIPRESTIVFHYKCFTCSKCSRPLLPGEQFFKVGADRVLCQTDYSQSTKHQENEVHSTTNERPDYWSPSPSPLQRSPHGLVSTTVLNSPSSSGEGHSVQDSLKELDQVKEECTEKLSANSPETSNSQVSTTTGKRRGPRTTIKSKQLEILKAAFKSNQKPTRNIREQLASETGLNMRVIQVWFQNRRSKERRMTQMKLANRGRYPLSREDNFHFADHFYRTGEGGTFYPDFHHHHHHHPHHTADPSYLHSLQLPSQPGEPDGPWVRGPIQSGYQMGPTTTGPAYQHTAASPWPISTEPSSQMAFPT